MRKQRAATGYSSVRVSNATKALLEELSRLIAPHELRGDDELLWEIATAEIARQRAAGSSRVSLTSRAS